MDKIDKFLNRRKQKNKRTVKLRDKYFEITKEDIKVVRSYKKNACLDDTVDMYRPYSTKFTLDTMQEPLKEYKVIEKSERTLKKEKTNFIKKNRDRVTKRRSTKPINVIGDVWNDGIEGLREYEQNILLDIRDSYKGEVDDLQLDKTGLQQELRRIYLKQYLPRERKQYKITDLIKPTPSVESLGPYPKEVACYWDKMCDFYSLNGDSTMYLTATDNVLEVFTINSILIFRLTLSKKIAKAKFGVKNELIVCSKGTLIVVEEENYNNEAFVSLSLALEDLPEETFHTVENVIVCLSLKAPITDFDSCQTGIIGCLTGKSLVLVDFKDKKYTVAHKFEGGTPTTITFHHTYTLVLVTTSNSIVVYDIHTKEELVNSKLFSYVVSARFKNNFVYVVNNTGSLYVFDYTRNVVVHTMYQNQECLDINVHLKYNLISVSTKKELIIFYCDVINQQVVVVKRTSGLYKSLDFHHVCPWLYCVVDKRMVMLT